MPAPWLRRSADTPSRWVTGDLISGVNAILAGVPLMLIAGGGLYEESLEGQNILAVANDSSINAPKDMIGKTIGVPTLVGLTTACLRAWLPNTGSRMIACTSSRSRSPLWCRRCNAVRSTLRCSASHLSRTRRVRFDRWVIR